ncbi:MAG: 3-phosphoshikimate 1-carboxyvinyltransferase [Clostridia bacterium]|jgi:3-phosphoshikimate 1-carboxyvinyltransferase
MKHTIRQARRLSGHIKVPGDKSISHRAIMMGALAKGVTEITGFLMGEDCLNTISCFQQLGINIDICGDSCVRVYGKGLHGLEKPIRRLDAGNSGTTCRILLGILAGQTFDSELTGDDSLRRRPMSRVVTPLNMMGAVIEGADGGNHLPLKIKGRPLHGIRYQLPVASAQLKSSLIMAGLFTDSPTHIHEPVPSRDHTELMLSSFGGNLKKQGDIITVEPVKELYGQSISIPGDISSAAFFITAALIIPDSQVRISNVGVNPTRTGILDVLRDMGASIILENHRTYGGEPVADLLVRYTPLKGTTIQGSIIPRLIDEIPILAVAAAFAEGTTVIKDAEELRFKESNRIDAVVQELSKMGVDIAGTPDGMIIHGGRPLRGSVVADYMDHRISMAMAVAALATTGETVIQGSEYINISYPGFFETLDGIISQ